MSSLLLFVSSFQVFAQTYGDTQTALKASSIGDQLLGALIGGAISGSVISVIVGALFNRRTAQIQEEIKSQFDIARSQRAWKEQSVSELLGPINMLLDRTEIAFSRWKANSIFLEAEIIARSNQKIRDLLLEKGYLIPPDLLDDASKLITHYDRWLEEFNDNRNRKDPKHQDAFTFVGTLGFPFPKRSADNFQQYFRKYWDDLYKSN